MRLFFVASQETFIIFLGARQQKTPCMPILYTQERGLVHVHSVEARASVGRSASLTPDFLAKDLSAARGIVNQNWQEKPRGITNTACGIWPSKCHRGGDIRFAAYAIRGLRLPFLSVYWRLP
jgi:hypothetical protein